MPEKILNKPNLVTISYRAQGAIDLLAPPACPNASVNRTDSFRIEGTKYDHDAGKVDQIHFETNSFNSINTLVLRCQGWELDPDKISSDSFDIINKFHPCTVTKCPFYRRSSTINITIK